MEHYRMFAAYNAWANRLVYDTAAELTEEELNRDSGAFFGSLFGTMSHVVTADRIWLNRFTGEGPLPASLDERPCAKLQDLREIREEEDQRIIAFAETLTPQKLDSVLEYTPIANPTPIKHRLGPAVAHFFNHQTHHRGQMHMALTALGKPSLALDLIYFLRSEGQTYL
ncbi:damage-inducible protein DinB [Peteryoungia desertarenae]|uniref:Damage-inducible protein DinB n=1 Tax=Peteryoungia desertarenae TaxID=1813451 RepID=A0ABX6QNE0_9HYPH|nr:DinB family protein [Peteryoungia desertarenae]QLF70014.1 damage-inducible protein DinB [Peteryoungia desertarenae]